MDLATRIATKQPKGEDNATFGRYLFEVVIGQEMPAVIHQHGSLTCRSSSAKPSSM
jgi:hypothetical protein